MPRNKFGKVLSKPKFGHCWYCEAKTCYALFYTDGSEVFSCESCLKKQGKIPRLTRKYLYKSKSSKFRQNSHREKQENLIVKLDGESQR